MGMNLRAVVRFDYQLSVFDFCFHGMLFSFPASWFVSRLAVNIPKRFGFCNCYFWVILAWQGGRDWSI
jgi:hypothetical protein